MLNLGLGINSCRYDIQPYLAFLSTSTPPSHAPTFHPPFPSLCKNSAPALPCPYPPAQAEAHQQALLRGLELLRLTVTPTSSSLSAPKPTALPSPPPPFPYLCAISIEPHTPVRAVAIQLEH